jgi:hypothetical protein
VPLNAKNSLGGPMLSEGGSSIGGVSLADFAASTEPTVPRYLLILARWWILFIFSLLAVMQAASWNFYGPISKAITEVYGCVWTKWENYQVVVLCVTFQGGTTIKWRGLRTRLI